MFVDTHCHLNMMTRKQPDTWLQENDFVAIQKVVEESKAKGVGKIVTVGTSLNETMNSVDIAKRFDGVFATAGIHPCDATEDWKQDFKTIKALVQGKQKNKIVGVGETGLDFYHKPFYKDRQLDVFKAHIELSIEYQLPLVIHMRDSCDEVLKTLEPYKDEITGVMHCFLQEKSIADTVVSWGMYVGIGAPITYPKNDDLRALVKDLSIDQLVLETDAPFLPPQEFRGKMNYPYYIPLFAQMIADIKGISSEELAIITTRNAETLFKT